MAKKLNNEVDITFIPDHIYETIFLHAMQSGVRLYDEKFNKFNLKLKEFTENRYCLDPVAEDENNMKFMHEGVGNLSLKNVYLFITFTEKDILYKYAMIKADSLDYIEKHMDSYLSYVLNGEDDSIISQCHVICFEGIYDKYIEWSKMMSDFKNEQTSQVIYQSKKPIKFSAINKFGEIFYFDPLRLDHNSAFPVTSITMPELSRLSVDNLWIWHFYPTSTTAYGFIIANSEEEAWEVIRENNIYEVSGAEMIDNCDGTVSPAYSMTIKSLNDNRSYIDNGSKFIKVNYDKENALKNFVENIAFLVKDTEIAISYSVGKMTIPFNVMLQKYRNAIEFMKHSDQNINISEITSVFAAFMDPSGFKQIYEKDIWLWIFEPYSVNDNTYGFVYGNGQDAAIDNLVATGILESRESDVTLHNLLDIMDLFDKSEALGAHKITKNNI